MCYDLYEIDERDSTGSTALMNAVRDTLRQSGDATASARSRSQHPRHLR